MVFTMEVKTGIKRILTILIASAILSLLATSFIVNAVFAQTGMDIPVTVSWSDRSDTTRPSSVTLRLMNGNTTVSTLTLTSANLDPSDSNKWVGVFDNVPYNANYTIVEDSVSDYSITSNNLSPSISAVTILESTRNTSTYTNTNTTHNLGDVNFIVFRSGDNYYVWTLDSYPTGAKRTELTSAVRSMIGNNNATISSYENGLPANISMNYWFLGGVLTDISGSEGNVSIRHTGGIFGGSISDVYYGNLVPGTTDGVSFENVKTIPTYNLTVHHLQEDESTPFRADVVTTYNEGDTYTASPISDPNYTSELKIGQATGIINQDTEVTYVYHPKFHNVTYQFTGSVQPPNASSLLPATATHDDGDTVTVAPEPTATGYRFLGWQMNGQSVSGTFTMPSQNVTIAGSWERYNGTFAPIINKTIANPQNIYRFGDTVDFLITVSNPEAYPISNVEIEEQLIGAKFIAHNDYVVNATDETKATIPTIPAGGVITLYVEYDIITNNTEILTNTARLTSASADNYYFLDTTQDYIASSSFNVQSWQDVPVLTGVNTNSITLYYILSAIGAVGVLGGVIVYQNNNKEREK